MAKRYDEDEIAYWYTANGARIPVLKGQSKEEALHALRERDMDEKERQIKQNRQEAEKQNHYKTENPKFKNGYGETSMEDAKIENGKPNSLLDNMDENGHLSAEREKKHREIIDSFFKDVRPVIGQPTFYMTGGGSGSGKSKFIKNPNEFMKQSNCVTVDSDSIKKMLPDWDEKNPDCAGYLHEESSALTKRIMKIARENNYNYLLDGTGDGSEKSLLKKINEAKNSGYRVEASYCTVDMNTAYERNEGRYYKQGRLVPYAMVRSTHMAVSNILPKVAKHFDSVKLYDNTNNMKLIAQGGGGKDLKVLDASKYAQFINKTNFTDLPYYYDDAVKERINKIKGGK